MAELAVPQATTVVQVSGTLPNGEVVTLDIPVQHPAGVQGPQIVAHAYNTFKQMGGFLVDTPNSGMKFYMASKFDAPFTFEIKNIFLIDSKVVR
jgi:hypothetical protein